MRAHATALVLVNWKGVFYERYLLDRHVTALEGDNGAGKTTVMIAAYLVLLPDLTKLRFTNLGETGATGGDRGIWGRLGDEARPSFAALELRLGDGTPLLMGVHLQRKSEPAIELTPFMISALGFESRAHDFLLESQGEHDEVPTLAEVQQKVAAAGGRITVFDTVKEYFSTLFELGVTPLRLSVDEDRAKYNDMLRTSMTGGISRVLTSELRSFVLRAQTELADTLGRMRGNLAACRRTRLEVSESRDLEREIAGIYDAGFSMFSAALGAAREAAREANVKLGEAGARHLATSDALNAAEAVLADALSRDSTIAARLVRAREEQQAAADRLARLERACALSDQVSALGAELAEAQRDVDEHAALQAAAVEARAAAKQRRTRAQVAYSQSAQGLAQLQTGLSELHQRAHAFRRVTAQWELAQKLLDVAQPVPHADAPSWATQMRTQVTTEREQLDRELARRSRAGSQLTLRREEYARAHAALGELRSAMGALRATDSSETPYAAALGALRQLNELEPRARLGSALEAELHDLQNQARRQQQAREQALQAGLLENGLGSAQLLARLGELDQAALAHERARQEHEWQGRAAAQRAEQLRQRCATLEEVQGRYQVLALAAARLTTHGVSLPTDTPDLSAERAALEQRLHATRVRLEQLTTEHKQSKRQVAELEAGPAPHPELLRLQELVGGELLARRYEDLEPEVARYVEAELGPLVSAIVVEDADAAARLLQDEPRELTDVWLVDGRTELAPLRGVPSAATRDVSVPIAAGLRVTRVPEVPQLGRAARERRAAALRKRVAARATSIEEDERAQTQLRALLHDLITLEGSLALFRGGEPGAALAEARAQLDETDRALAAHEQAAQTERQRAQEARAKADLLRPLVPIAALLDGPEAASLVAQRAQQLADARAAQAELTRCQTARATLTEWVDALRNPPPSDEELASWQQESASLDTRRDTLFTLDAALLDIATDYPALAWSEATRALETETQLVPELEAQHELLRTQAEVAEQEVETAEHAWEQATHTLQAAQAQHAAVLAQWVRAKEELSNAGADAPEPDVRELARATERDCKQQQARVEAEERELTAEIALGRERCRQSAERAERSRAEVDSARAQAEPAERAWRRLQERIEKLELPLPPVTAEEDGTRGSSATRAARAASKFSLLLDRLTDSPIGAELSAELQARSASDAESYVGTWQQVRTWLQRRLPAQVAEVADPLEALMRLRDDLTRLETRLTQQEGELRGASEDVARSIDVQVRKAANQVRRLNQNLEGIQFGSIQGIRIKMGRVERMTQVLEALRDGSAQRLLFQSALPFEEALDEIFVRYGGGRSGGQRILDYREYIDLQVEVQRRTSSEWELANPTRVSTGEAIGVGAALMMVILTEWERDANLLRSKRTAGALRLLFLDEANRLSQDNLGVLFELCQTLDLQLLIAAPEVARAEGNTTYRLVRRVLGDGREEVVVSGRRSTLPGAIAAAASEKAEAEQLPAPEPELPAVVAETFALEPG
jgi:chromosome partition protein MukB